MTMEKTKVRELPKIRQVIDGYVYDTETASVLYRYNSDDDSYEYMYSYEIGLLQNVWGHYFTYIWEESKCEEGYRMRSLTREDAIKWAEKHCNWLIEQIFGKLHEAGEGPAYTPKE